MTTLTAIIPVYNERLALVSTLAEWVPALTGVGAEILVIDDGSTDGAFDVATGFGNVSVLRHAVNRGYGAALKTGLAAATGELILTIDADGTYPASSFPAMWAERQADMVIGARSSEPDRLKAVAKSLIFAFAGLVAGARIPDLNTGLRLVRLDLARQWASSLPDGFSATTTLTMAALIEHRTIVWVPIDYRRRIGPSKFHPIKDTFRLTRQVVRSRSLFRR